MSLDPVPDKCSSKLNFYTLVKILLKAAIWQSSDQNGESKKHKKGSIPSYSKKIFRAIATKVVQF